MEPVNMNLDIKRFTPNSKSTSRNQMWNIDGIMDIIHITLGQRDLSTILAIYSDNIGEGKLLDLLPVPTIRSPTDGTIEADETVKTLEAFFSEPDGSLDGKLSVDGLSIEEIGPDVNIYDKRFSLVISLSGLHSLFYDVGLHSMEPYTILKQCDIELSRTYTEEKGEKVTASVSSIYIQLCNRVVYSLNDILNDIVEHFKVPDGEVSPTRYKRNEMMTKIPEDLWEPKRLKEYICKDEYADVKNVPPPAVHEIFLLPKTEVMIVLELEEIPVIIIKATLELAMCDSSTLLNSTCELTRKSKLETNYCTIQANYFNEKVKIGNQLLIPQF
ncbi:hypothetical protein QE152_g31312 [Popillia japonica]|uniref:Uncharacterized protein n=1 Tax=Popillia japonica TaxID=7064 RepID=A0AAW1JB94_POPJA